MVGAQVMQTYARANKLPLDVMRFVTEVTTKSVEQVTEPAMVGNYIHGLVLEGARCVSKEFITVSWQRLMLMVDLAAVQHVTIFHRRLAFAC